jgi:capsular exopolysaccharide synthesis family protein
MEPEETGLTGTRISGVLRARAPWILVCVVLVAAVAYGYARHKTDKYTATAALAFNSSQLAQQIAGLSTSDNLTPLAQQQINLELVKVGGMAAKTASLLGHGLTAEQVNASLDISVKGESSIIYVAAISTSPVLAADIANTYVNAVAKEQQGANRQFYKAALALVRKQLASLTPAQRFGTDALDLQDRAHTLDLLAELDYNTVEVAQEALVPSSPSSPKVAKDTGLGALLGLLLGFGVVFLLENRDRRIREPEDLEAIYDLPLLDAVPKSAALRKPGAALPPAEAEVFNLIRAHLRFFNVDRDLSTLVIASAASGDGKTTIARHLAEAAARLGSRVLLLEVDLRKPTLAQQLGIRPGHGLADVLIGAASMEKAIQSVSLRSSNVEGVGRPHTLDVLVAGAVLPPNPGELLASGAMDVVLTRAKSTYDFVVIDTPPLVMVSDAFPLLTKVDGVVLVGRIGYSKRGTAEQLHQVLAGSGARLLGVIANGSKSDGTSAYLREVQSLPAVVSANGAPSSGDLAPTAKS